MKCAHTYTVILMTENDKEVQWCAHCGALKYEQGKWRLPNKKYGEKIK